MIQKIMFNNSEKSEASENFFGQVYRFVCAIPEGKVATYGQIARLCGRPRASRAVGYALHVNPAPGVIPCHRVVNRLGRLAPAFAFGGASVQRALLESEGVTFNDKNTVNLQKHHWEP